MPSVKVIGYTKSKTMKKTTSMNKYVADHGNKTNYNKVVNDKNNLNFSNLY